MRQSHFCVKFAFMIILLSKLILALGFGMVILALL